MIGSWGEENEKFFFLFDHSFFLLTEYSFPNFQPPTVRLDCMVELVWRKLLFLLQSYFWLMSHGKAMGRQCLLREAQFIVTVLCNNLYYFP